MPRSLRQFLLVPVPLILAVVSPASLARSNGAAAEVRIADSQFNQALERSDASALREMILDSYVFTDPKGRISSKEQVIGGVESGRITIQSQTTKDVRVTVLGDTAIETGLLTSVAMRDGRNSGGTFRFTRVWIKRGGRWRTAAFQETAPEEPASSNR